MSESATGPALTLEAPLLNRVRHLKHALAAAAACASIAAPAAAQVKIQATSILSGNVLALYGLGDIGGGVGHGTYQVGSCAFNGGANRSYCTTSGSYVETAASVNPGATGTFTWRMSWAGNGPNPIQTRSTSPGSNNAVLYVVPPGSFFEVFLGTGLYANLDFGVPDTPNPTGGALNWQAFLGNAVCTGNPPACSVGPVLLTNGATISGSIGQFNMQLDYPRGQVPTVTPEPATVALVAGGLALVGAWGGGRRRREVGV
jgi:hypothetical protein